MKCFTGQFFHSEHQIESQLNAKFHPFGSKKGVITKNGLIFWDKNYSCMTKGKFRENLKQGT